MQTHPPPTHEGVWASHATQSGPQCAGSSSLQGEHDSALHHCPSGQYPSTRQTAHPMLPQTGVGAVQTMHPSPQCSALLHGMQAPSPLHQYPSPHESSVHRHLPPTHGAPVPGHFTHSVPQWSGSSSVHG